MWGLSNLTGHGLPLLHFKPGPGSQQVLDDGSELRSDRGEPEQAPDGV